MSQLANLKAQIDAVAVQAQRMAGQLQAFRQQFHVAARQVEGTIGGSAQGKDRALVDSISAAQRQVDQAAAALMAASSSARTYGNSL